MLLSRCHDVISFQPLFLPRFAMLLMMRYSLFSRFVYMLPWLDTLVCYADISIICHYADMLPC